MRTPTPHVDLYGWWMVALGGGDPETTHDPQPGYYKRRLVKGGPWVAARIWLDQPIDELGELCGDETLQCEVAGRWADPEDAWTWLCANPISEQEFKYLTALAEHCAAHEPSHPSANPRQPINHLQTPLHF
jgi:hypothetical protein